MDPLYNRTFVASSELFSGFKVEINIQSIDTLGDIIKIFVNELKSVLKQHNFEVLLGSVDVKKFHIHSYTLEQILVSNKDELFYICDHSE